MSDISGLGNETQRESGLNYKLTNNIQLHVTRLYSLLLSVHITVYMAVDINNCFYCIVHGFLCMNCRNCMLLGYLLLLTLTGESGH